MSDCLQPGAVLMVSIGCVSSLQQRAEPFACHLNQTNQHWT